MAAKANVIGIYIKDGGTLTLGRESTVADDGVAGINLRAYLSTSFVVIDDASGANLNGNTAGSNTSGSRENQVTTTGYDTNDKNVEIFADSMDAGIIKFKINHSAANKTVKLEDTGLSDVTFDTGTTSILASNLSTGSAILVGSNAGSANTVLDVSSNNYTIRCGQGMNFYNGGTLLARAATLYLGTSDSSPYAGENSSRYGINLSSGKLGGTSTSAAPTGTWYVSSVKSTSSSNILRFTTGTCTITGKNTSANRFFEITDGNVYHSDGTITIDSGVAAEMQWDAASTDQDNGPYNFIINDASCTARIRTALEVLNNMTVTAGTFNTHSNDGSADKNLDVTGWCDVTGTLALNDSTVEVAALRCNSGAVVTQGSSGALTFAGGSNFAGSGSTEGSTYSLRNLDGTSDINLGGTITCNGGSYFEPRTAPDYASVLNHVVCASGSYWVGKVTIGGNFTVNAGHKWQTYGGSKDFVVTGDVLLNGHLSATSGYLAAGSTGEMKFGSLTIASGGTYTATPLTTTITNENSSGFTIQNSGTFTHNKGLVKIDLDSPTTTQASNGPYWDFTQVDSATDFYPAEAFEVLNDLYFVGDFEFQNNAHHLTVHRNMTIGDGTTATRYMPYHTRTCNLTVGGVLEVTNGATLTNFSHGTVNVGGVRNTGGTM